MNFLLRIFLFSALALSLSGCLAFVWHDQTDLSVAASPEKMPVKNLLVPMPDKPNPRELSDSEFEAETLKYNALVDAKKYYAFYTDTFAAEREALGLPKFSENAFYSRGLLFKFYEGNLCESAWEYVKKGFIERAYFYKDENRNDFIFVLINYPYDHKKKTKGSCVEAEYFHNQKKISKDEFLALIKKWRDAK